MILEKANAGAPMFAKFHHANNDCLRIDVLIDYSGLEELYPLVLSYWWSDHIPFQQPATYQRG
jgi:hypothetical protein